MKMSKHPRLLLGFLLFAGAALAAEDEDDNTDFLLNVFSDVGPILALFGEQFARQFLSETFTWEDHVIFACIPLGIMTAIAGAIRVQGHHFLKAFIGRARENYAAAEIEYMSSTSNEVCELFNGKGIVRTMGKPSVAQLIVIPDQLPKSGGRTFDSSCGIHTLQSATFQSDPRDRLMYGKEYSDEVNFQPSNLFRRQKKAPSPRTTAPDEERGQRASDSVETRNPMAPAEAWIQADWDSLRSPNLQLNATPETGLNKVRRIELLAAVIAAVSLQISLLIIGGTTSTLVSGYASKPWGLPCYLAGSILLVIGMVACSVAIERSTEEYTWQFSEDQISSRQPGDPGPGRTGQFHLFWIQRTQRVSDQDFGSHVIYGGERNRIVTSSRCDDVHSKKITLARTEGSQTTTASNDARTNNSEAEEGNDGDLDHAPWWLKYLPLVAVVAGGGGFTVQFIGLRGLPWPCAVSQLIAIMVMAMIRALIRRHLGKDLKHWPAAENYELDFLAIQLVTKKSKIFDKSSPQTSNEQRRVSFGQLVNLYQRTWLWLFKDKSYSKNQDSGKSQVPENLFVWRVETAEVATAEVAELGTYAYTFPYPRHSTGEKNNEGQRVVLVRKRLGDVCKWTTSASKPALALARSIERFLEEFVPSGLPATKNASEVSHENVHGDASKNTTGDPASTSLPDTSEPLEEGDRIEWKIPFSSSEASAKTEVKLFITRRLLQDGAAPRWEVDFGGVEAVLSLWMANLEAKSSHQDKNDESTDWRRVEAASTVEYCRILGERRNGVLKRDISWWVNNPEIEQRPRRSNAELSMATDSGAKDHQNHDIKIVVGFAGPSESSDKPTEPTKVSDLVVQHSIADLATLTAQHLFTSFMWNIGKYFPRQALHQGDLSINKNVKVQSSSTFDLHSNVDKLSGRKLSHSKLTKFVTYAEKQGLGTRDEILLCIIPTLSFYDRLPNDAVFYCDLPELKLPESSRSRDQAFASYSYFLKWIKIGASPEEYLTLAGVARTMEFIYLMALDHAASDASIPSESKPSSNSDNEELESDASSETSGPGFISSYSDSEMVSTSDQVIYRPRKRNVSCELVELLKLLSGPLSNTVNKLLPFYELQGRKQTIMGYFDICLEDHGGVTWAPERIIDLEKQPDKFLGRIGFTDLHREVATAVNGVFSWDSILGKNGMKRDVFGWTAFHYVAARTDLDFRDRNPDLRTLKTFFKKSPPTGWWLDNFNRSPVHVAAFSGNNVVLKDLLETFPGRDTKSAITTGGRDGMKPLHLAAGRKHKSCVATLLGERFGSYIEVDVWKQSPIHTAVINRSYECALQIANSKNFDLGPEIIDRFGKSLIFYFRGKDTKKKLLGAEILQKHWEKFDYRDGDMQSVLHHAIWFLEDDDFFDLLRSVKNRDKDKFNVDSVNRFRESPLHLAVSAKRPGLVDNLMYFRASPSVLDRYHLSPMMIACDSGSLSMVKIMCQRRHYQGSEKDRQRRTALHHAMLSKKWSSHDLAEATKMLAGVMETVDVRDQDFCTPLHYAAGTCKVLGFSTLVESKANIKLIDRSGRNVLHHAVLSHDKASAGSKKEMIETVCEHFLKDAADLKTIDSKDEDGNTALHLAVGQNDNDSVFALLAKDVDLQATNYSGMTPFILACRRSYCFKFIYYAVQQSNITQSHSSIDQPIMEHDTSKKTHDSDDKEMRLESSINPKFKGFDINQVDSRFGLSALAWACDTKSMEVVEKLLQADAVDLSIQATKYKGYTPLHLALDVCSQEIVLKLLNDRRVTASLEIEDNDGRTSIEFAIRESNESCLRELLRHSNAGAERFSVSQLEAIMDKYPETESQDIACHEWVMRVQARPDIPFPFHKLAKAGRLKEVKSLIDANLDPFQSDEDRWTAADVAEWYGHVNLMRLLRAKDPQRDIGRSHYSQPSIFFDIYENSILKTSSFPGLDSNPRLRLDVKIPEKDSVDKQFCYLRTKEAIPPTTKDFYFEVELLQLPESKVIAVGFCQSHADKNRLPGWDKGTWAYHSDDGGLYIETEWGMADDDENICEQGHRMGVGLNMETGGFYRTHNGNDIEPRKTIPSTLHHFYTMENTH
ncbi:serine threonine phosphatase 6 regulatory ankyrin repeat subunit a [Fusarium mexicanum]|uniref:Serine threonine phosphatase 6 regulatory ankyrin repeat subunit a n=1 Tax=Fusarium mexicanum TaxID=751941 RepID=A0A8H5MXN0_9HYPO|nr:serine threonine phosphatase 6 regulatory ankyrin repeat subunit a [Fusarium mexicanum]